MKHVIIWTDGTKEGLHLITFYPSEQQDVFSKDYKFNVGFQYK